jgi:hypothetical protein
MRPAAHRFDSIVQVHLTVREVACALQFIVTGGICLK